MTTIFYGLLTLVICLWSAIRGRKGVDYVSAITFVGWLAYQVVTRAYVFSTEQAGLAIIDAVQAVGIGWAIYKFRLGLLPLMVVCCAFASMIGMHLSIFADPGRMGSAYWTALNCAYLLQLSVLAGMTLRDEFLHASSRHSDRLGLGHSRGPGGV